MGRPVRCVNLKQELKEEATREVWRNWCFKVVMSWLRSGKDGVGPGGCKSGTKNTIRQVPVGRRCWSKGRLGEYQHRVFTPLQGLVVGTGPHRHIDAKIVPWTVPRSPPQP